MILFILFLILFIVSGLTVMGKPFEDWPKWAYVGLLVGGAFTVIGIFGIIGENMTKSAIVSYIAEEYDVSEDRVNITAFSCGSSGQYTCMVYRFEATFRKNGELNTVRGTIDKDSRVFIDTPPQLQKGTPEKRPQHYVIFLTIYLY